MLTNNTESLEFAGRAFPAAAYDELEFDILPDMSLAGQAGATPGAFATTPTSDYSYVAVAQGQGTGGSVDALMAGSKWSSQDAAAKTIITYSFANPATSTFSYAAMTDFTATVTGFSDADKVLTRTLLSTIEAVANVEFVEVPDDATECGVLRYGYSQEPNTMNYAGYAFFPSSNTMGGDIWIGTNQSAPMWDFYRPNLILHETLHALGLKHPFDAAVTLPTDQNIIPNTVMSYSPVAGGTSGWMSKYPSEPMPMDIAALQYLYGPANTNPGNTTYDLSGSQFQAFDALYDAGGTDTLDASHLSNGVALDLNSGAFSNIGYSVTAMARAPSGSMLNTTYTSTLAIASGTQIENATGSNYNDVLAGNALGNTLSGGLGNDSLEGREGNDTIDGGGGMDTAVVHASHAGYSITGSGGLFTVSGAATGTDSLSGVERVVFDDANIALDLGGNAGVVVKAIGAVFGSGAVHNPQYVGMGLGALDGGMAAETMMHIALGLKLGDAPTNEAVVKLLYTNVVGAVPSADVVASYVHLIENGTYTQESLGLTAMEHALNLQHIDFTGLAGTGIAYV